jgi:hypothetical protein
LVGIARRRRVEENVRPPERVIGGSSHRKPGNDVALFVNSADLPDVLSHLLDAVASHRLDDAQINASVQRVLAAKSYDPCCAHPSG